MNISQTPVTILLFALAKEQAGQSSIAVSVPLPTSVRELKEKLASEHPTLAPLIAISRFAVDRSFANDNQTIYGKEEIAMIPPVSGG
jgi:molybdopterin converting factor subunit 1